MSMFFFFKITATLKIYTYRPSLLLHYVLPTLHAGYDIHEGRLAGAVLADEAVDLAGADREVHVPEGVDAAEGLRDAAQLEQRGLGHRAVPPIPLPEAGGPLRSGSDPASTASPARWPW